MKKLTILSIIVIIIAMTSISIATENFLFSETNKNNSDILNQNANSNVKTDSYVPFSIIVEPKIIYVGTNPLITVYAYNTAGTFWFYKLKHSELIGTFVSKLLYWNQYSIISSVDDNIWNKSGTITISAYDGDTWTYSTIDVIDPIVTATPTSIPIVTPTATPIQLPTPTPTDTPIELQLSAGNVIRSGLYNVNINRSINITLTPSLPSLFNMYQVIEKIPTEFTFVSTDTNVYNNNNTYTFTNIIGVPMKYTVIVSPTAGIYTFNGTFKDSNRNVGTVSGDTQIVINNLNYDINNNGKIDKSEAILAVVDYFNGIITRNEAIDTVLQYFLNF